MDRTLNVRHRLKYDTYINWMTNNPTLFAGEVAIATFPQDDTSGESTTLPAILLKVGDGTHSYSELPFVSAKAADVHSWAKMTEDEMKDWIHENASNIENIKDGSGVGSLEQSFDTETWSPINQQVIEAINSNLGTADDGYTINVDETGKAVVGAFGKHSIMTGGKSQNVGKKSFTAGSKNIAFENNSAAFGNETFAKGKHSFAQGNRTTASGNASMAIGQETEASGAQSFAGGLWTQAKGDYSAVLGLGTVAGGNEQFVHGRYNVEDNGEYAHIVGNGWVDRDESGNITEVHPRNAYTLDWNGNAWFAGNVTVGDNKDKLVTVSELSQVISNMDNLKYSMVSSMDELPDPSSEDAQNTIFLIPRDSSDKEGAGLFDEYLCVNGVYEPIGTVDIDMTNYVEKSPYHGVFSVEKEKDSVTLYYTSLDGTPDAEKDVRLCEKEYTQGLQYYKDMFIRPTDQNYFTFECDDENLTATVTSYTGSETSIVIPFEYINDSKVYKVTSIKGGYGSYGPENKLKNAQTIILPNTITSIGEYGFACSKITSLELPSSVKTIGNYAFYQTTSLKTLKLNEGLESLSGSNIFIFSNLNYLEIPSTVKFIYSNTLAPNSSGTNAKMTVRILNPNYEFDPEDIYTSNVTFICPENSLCEQSLINLKLSDVQQKTFDYSIDSISMTDMLILNCGDSNF